MHERLIAYLDPSDHSVTKIEELEVELEVSQNGEVIASTSSLIK